MNISVFLSLHFTVQVDGHDASPTASQLGVKYDLLWNLFLIVFISCALTVNLCSSYILPFQASSLKMGAATEVDKAAALATAANEARGLAMDSIAAAHSGHMGLPLGCAEIGSVLYGSQVSAC